jgi:hypothetical protein
MKIVYELFTMFFVIICQLGQQPGYWAVIRKTYDREFLVTSDTVKMVYV